jgi:diguanylate cyclase (GGDEF)-like protein
MMWGFAAGALIVLYVYMQDQMIQIDGLTGVWTRRSFHEHMRQLPGNRADRTWGILFLDIDDFKTINDCFGHAEGDAALKLFAKMSSRCAAGRHSCAAGRR